MIKNVIIIILILGLMAVIVFLDVPGFQNILDLRRTINSERDKLSEKQEISAKVQELVKTYEDNRESVEKSEYVLPSGEKIPDLIVQVEALALGQGLLLENIDIATVKEEKGRSTETLPLKEKAVITYKTLNVSMKFAGSYEAFKGFLKAIEENIRLMDITSVGFSSVSEQGSKIFNFNIALTTYYQ